MPATGDGLAPNATHRPGAPAGRLATRRGGSTGRTAEFPGGLAARRPMLSADGIGRPDRADSTIDSTGTSTSTSGVPLGVTGGPASGATGGVTGTATPIPRPRGAAGGPAVSAPSAPLRLLVIDNDASDAALIERLVADGCTPIEVTWADGIEQAAAQLSGPSTSGRRNRSRGAGFSCVLLDLVAPDAAPAHPSVDLDNTSSADGTQQPDAPDGLDGLRELLRRAPHTAVVVLTDAAASELGAAAVAAGAQDFLVKHETDGPLLARALRYAVERKRADESQRRLVEAELRGQENARLQRHLLPTPLLDGAGLSFTRRYRPGRRRALLGGDFYDAVRTEDGTVHVVIGDVCGHGPDEAALGVALRIAWRTLVFAGLTGKALLSTLQHVLEHERRSDEIFATLCMLVLSPGPTEAAEQRGKGARRSAPVERARLYLAGHPSPLLLRPDGRPILLPTDQAGPALGLLACDDSQAVWPAQEVELPSGWGLLLYTDGLVEGRIDDGSRRLGSEGLVDLIGAHQAAGLTRGRLVDSAIAEVEELNGGALTDDVAVLLLERPQSQLIMG
ncbi:serine phosphatase RsbU (regulator of sigma subunit) [Kitasatospora sp. MAP12-15]|uniref:PP2C family protein-serine/threonine phosphatase n=1 Tax=unclassified Kitasatospora TaxID=2633591 RepID=UPI002473B6F7|nr:SpoIIE family protein phosphatase [Kitasatospora sp. MAP12-44]MDH6111249.1 serine phosphatase RsbU (regulator of sigma subunit) [Kitasatospora sp. MAP12-44]